VIVPLKIVFAVPAVLAVADEQLSVDIVAVGVGFGSDDFLHAWQKMTNEKIRI
jgi:hypothetical protein